MFNHEQFGSVRTLKDADGRAWLVAKDVCDALGLVNVTRALAGLDDDEKDTLHIVKGGVGNNFVNESGLYSLVMRSRKPEAKAFKKWVTSEVLPAIRKDDMYVAGEEKVASGDMSIEEMTLNVMSHLSAKVERLQAEKALVDARALQLENTVTIMEPKVEVYERTMSSDGTFTLTEAMKSMHVHSVYGRRFAREIVARAGLWYADGIGAI